MKHEILGEGLNLNLKLKLYSQSFCVLGLVQELKESFAGKGYVYGSEIHSYL